MCKDIKISDIITIDDIDKWTIDEIVFIEVPTGSGKSHFIKYKLAEHNPFKKILMLVNRTIIKNQSETELLKIEQGNITITTYQNISNKILLKQVGEFEGYDYIICDEVHHFTDESEFINTTDLSFKWVINQQAIKIFMTATAYFIKGYIKDELKLKTKDYIIENTYDYIEFSVRTLVASAMS